MVLRPKKLAIILVMAIFVIAIFGFVKTTEAAFITSGNTQWSTVGTTINYSSGNVGIGTSNPQRALHIYKNGAPALRLESSSSNQGIEMITQSNKYNWLLGAQYNIDNSFEITPSTAVGGTTFSTPVAVFRQNGNVGIGTTTPNAKLQVAGSINATGLCLSGDCKAAWADIVSAGGGNQWVTSGNNIYNANTANVGIGDTNPANTLSVAGNIAGSSALKITNSSANNWISGNFGVGNASNASSKFGVFGNASIGSTYFTYAAPTNGLIVEGNVGIGTTNPTAKLDVAGGNIDIDNTTFASQTGVITKNGTRFIHDFNYGNNGTVTTDGANTFIGINSGNLTMGSTATLTYQASYNTAVGNGSLSNNSTGYNNSALGYQSLYYNTAGYYNSALGVTALRNNVTGGNNSAFGYASLYYNTTGYSNSAFGYSSLNSNVSGSNGTALGFESQKYVNNTSTVWTNYNTSVGYQALRGSGTAANNTGNNNTAFGYQTLLNNTTGSSNTAAGVSSLTSNTTGAANSALGNGALSSNTTGNHNSAFGVLALQYNTSGSFNSAFGREALNYITTGGNNSAFGFDAGRYIANGSTSNTISSNSTYLGWNTKAYANGDTNETVIGYNATGIGSNSVTLGNDSVATTALKGNVGIGTTAPNAKLQVGGTTVTTGLAFSSNPTDIKTSWADIVSAGGGNQWVTNGNNIYNNNSGYVGIGTTNPIVKLDVAGTAFFGINNKLKIQEINDALSIQATASSSDSTKKGIIINAWGGNVGIGDSNPANKLSVVGDIAGSSALEITNSSTNSWVSGNFGVGNASNASSKFGVFGNASIGSGYFSYAAPSNGLIVEGNVGIGITNPGSKLQVIGKTQITDAAAGADTQNYATFGVTREASSSALAYIAMTRSGSIVKAMGIDGSNNWIFGQPTSGTQIINNPFMTIQSGGNVGIGTTNPQRKLDLSNNGQITFGNDVTTDSTSGIYWHSGSGYGIYRSAGAWTSPYPKLQVSFYTGIDIYSEPSYNLSLQKNGGNVGIGTNTPNARLQVAGNTITTGLAFSGNPTDIKTSWADIVSAGGGNQWITSGANIYNSNTANVGVGTTNPTFKLDVNGSIGSSLNSATAYIDTGKNVTPWDSTFEENITGWSSINSTSFTQSTAQAYDGSYSFRIKRNDTGGSGGASYIIGTQLIPGKTYTLSGYYKMVNGSGTTRIKLNSNGSTPYTSGTTYTDKTLANASNWTFFSISVVASAITSGNNYVWVGADMPDTTQELYLDDLVLSEGSLPAAGYNNLKSSLNGKDSFFGGNVGIGDSAPANTLSVAGNIAGSSALKITNSSANNWVSGNFGVGNASNASSKFGVFGNASIGTTYFTYAAPTNGLIVEGNVGVGTTAPNAKLQVLGDVSAAKFYTNGYTPPANSSLHITDINGILNSGDTLATIRGFYYGDDANANILSVGVAGASNWEKFVVKFNGNVGIGTTNPQTKLHIYGSSDATYGLFEFESSDARNTKGPFFSFKDASGPLGWIGYYSAYNSGKDFVIKNYVTDGGIRFNAGNSATASMMIDSTGNVGIGTTNPGQKLDIYNSGDTVFRLVGNSDSGWISRFSNRLHIASNDMIQFGTGGQTDVDMTIDSIGNVGIGTTTPNARLQVAGNTITTGLAFSGNPTDIKTSWADIVTAGGIGTGTSGQTLRNNGSTWVANSTLYNNGTNIGIGTTNPGNLVQIYAKNGQGLLIGTPYRDNEDERINSIDFLAWRDSYNGNNNFVGASISTERKWTCCGGYPSAGYAGIAYTDLVFKTRNSSDIASGTIERMRIAYNGNVGIGDSAPANTLSVAGNIAGSSALKITNSSANNWVSGNFGVGNASNASSKFGVFGNASIGSTYFTYAAPTNGLIVEGNVGVGTTNPGAKLDVVGGNIDIDNTTFANQNGVITKSGARFIHDFNYGNNGTVTTDGANTFVGRNAGNFSMGSTATLTYQASYNSALGIQSLQNNTTGSHNSALGAYSLYNNTTGVGNSALGQGSLQNNTTGGANSTLGQTSLYSNITGSYNSALGNAALYSNIAGNNGTALGYESQRNVNSTSTPWTNYNTSVGFQALRGSGTPANNTGNYNTAIGGVTLLNNTTGSGNSVVGYGSLNSNTTGSDNSAFGINTLINNTTGNQNSTLGREALYSNTTGSYNSAFGFRAGRYIADGSTANQTSNNSVYLGYNTRAYANGDTNETVIGYNAVGIGSNSVVLGNDSVAVTALKGNVGIATTNPQGLFHVYSTASSTNALVVANNGQVGINTTTPGVTLDVNGTINSKGLCLSGDCKAAWSDIVTAGGIGTGTNGQTLRHNGTSWVANSNLYNNGTNIGIGTASPGAKLQIGTDGSQIWVGATGTGRSAVVGSKISAPGSIGGTNGYGAYFAYDSYYDETTASWLPVRSTIGGKWKMEMGYNSGDVRFSYSATSTPIAWSDFFTIKNSGNIGIADTNPANTLSVAGNIAGNSALKITNSTANNWISGNVGVGNATNGASKLSVFGNQSIGTTYFTYPAPANGLIVEGNVGIGTTNPTSKLFVNGDTAINGKLTINSLHVNAGEGLDIADGGDRSASSTLGGHTPNDTRVINLSDGNPITDGALLFTVDSSVTGDHAGELLYLDNNYFEWKGKPVLSNNSGTSNYVPKFSGTTYLGNSLIYDNGTNVGIGTTTPNAKLQVNGSINAAGLCLSGDCKTKWSDIVTAGGGNQWVTSGNNIYNANTGNVGVGITGALAKLHIADSGVDKDGFNTANGNLIIQANTGSRSQTIGSQIEFMIPADSNGGNMWGQGRIITVAGNTSTGNASGLMILGTRRYFDKLGTGSHWYYGDDLSINQSGNVGIADTNPANTLSVAGNIAGSSALKITNSSANNWISGNVGIGNATNGGSKLSIFGNQSIGTTFFTYAAPANGLIVEGTTGIGTTNPLVKLSINQGSYGLPVTSGTAQTYGALRLQAESGGNVVLDMGVDGSVGTWLQTTNRGDLSQEYPLLLNPNGGSVGIGTAAPGSYKLNVSGSTYLNGTVTATGAATFNGGAAISGNLAMSGTANITNVNKITANVVDPLYNIKGTNYSTFASAIAGGLKEEYIGRVAATDFAKKDSYYETTIDLAKQKEGSDLWVWYHVIEFNDQNVEVFLTPRNGFASTYSLISGSKLIIRADHPTDLSMRLVGSRFDWRQWPTKPFNQTEKASLIIK